MRRVISLGGVAVALLVDDSARWPAVDALFGACPEAEGNVLVTLQVGATAGPVPERAPDVAYSDVDLWFTDRGALTRHRRGLVVQRDGDVITAGGAVVDAGYVRAFRRSVQHVLVDALAEHGRFALHAALVARDGEAVGVLGDTGSGKSTLAVSAIARGWSVLGDDIAFAVAGDGTAVDVTAFPKPLHVPVEAVHTRPIGAADAIVLRDDPRSRLVVQGQVGVSHVARRLRGLIVVRHGAAGARLEPLPSGPRLLTLIMRSYPLQASPARVREFFPLAARISRLPAVLFEHASDPVDRIRQAADLLPAAWEACTPSEAQNQ